jgi:MFS family permease
VVDAEPALLVTAFLAGAFAGLWFVAMPPAVAHLVPEKHRPLGFSLWVGTGITAGIFGGLAAGRLPGWLAAAGLAETGEAKQFSILIGCAVALLSVWPLLRLRLPVLPARQRKTYPSGPFVRRFFLAFAVWQLAIGAFNPLFNAYFSQTLGASAERIGTAFAGSQLSQAAAVLASPWILMRTGIVKGVAAMQLATAASLAGLLFAASAAGAFPFYAAYMSFQVMSEPGMFGMLMNRVTPAERNGASAMIFVVMFGCHAVAAALGGWVAGEHGYSVMILAASALAAAAAFLFGLLLSHPAGPVRPGQAGPAHERDN